MKYRVDQYDSVYVLETPGDNKPSYYVFIGKLNGRTEQEFIKEYETYEMQNQEGN